MIKRYYIAIIQLVIMLALTTLPTHAAEWTTSAGIAPAISYTDNVCLSAENEQGEWIALATPDISLSGEGNRANMDLYASVEINSLTDSKIDDLGCNPSGFGSRSQFAPRVRANADAILVENWFYIDANASVYQNEISPFIAGGSDSLNRTGNTNTTTHYSVSPYVARRFKDEASLLLRYIWDEQFNSADQVRDSTRESVLFNLGSNPANGAMFWGLQADYNNVKYGNGALDVREAEDSELASAQLNLGYQFNRNWQINGHYGEEKNDFISFSDEIDGDFWDAGIRWTPNARTVVEAGTGDRFFGSTPRFSVKYQHKHSSFNAGYSRNLTYDRDIRALDNGQFSNGDNPNQSVDSNIGLPVGTESNQTTLTTSPILDDRFTLGYAYTGRRSTLSLNASHSDQTRAEDNRDSTFRRFSLTLNRSLSRQLTVTGALNWEDQQPQGDRSESIGDSETWRFLLSIQRPINSNTNLSLDYQYTDRQSDRANDGYIENRITLTVRFRV